MPAFLRLQAVPLLQAVLLQAVLILAKPMFAFMKSRPLMPSLIILVAAMIPLPKLQAAVVRPLLAVRSSQYSSDTVTPSN